MTGGAERKAPAARPVVTAPRDGRMLRLLVDYSGEDAAHALEDALQGWTIGFNNSDNDEEAEWQFAGWCWSHDHFNEGRGRVIGWLPFHPEADEEARYFITGDDEQWGAMTLKSAHHAIAAIFDHAADFGSEDLGELTVWCGMPVSKSVLVEERQGIPCDACCGGELEEEWEEATGGETCPVCDGHGRVNSDDPQEPWTSHDDAIAIYEMRPALPPVEVKGE